MQPPDLRSAAVKCGTCAKATLCTSLEVLVCSYMEPLRARLLRTGLFEDPIVCLFQLRLGNEDLHVEAWQTVI